MYNRPSSSPEQLNGIVERVTFHNEENGFCVLRIMVKGRKELVVLVGHIASIAEGEYVQAEGHWFHDKQHGLQFKAKSLTAAAPTTIEGIIKYLGSGMIKGIGPVYAKKLVGAFKEDVFDIIDNEPHRLQHVPGIGPLRAEKIVKGWADQKIIRDIMVFLHSHGVSTSRAVRIYKTYGEESINVITSNPYQLAKDIKGIGFITADKIAESLGIEKTSLIRARAGISYALTMVMEEGHCGYPIEELLTFCQKLLDIPLFIIQEALVLELKHKELVPDTIDGTPCVFLPGLYLAERNIAARILMLKNGILPWPSIDIPKAIEWVQQKNNITLSSGQQKAIEVALSSKVAIITGGPGVGKTTLVNSIIKILNAKRVDIALCAPTGRAAKRMTESTGQEAKTIHRLLEINPATGEFSKNEEYCLKSEVFIVDEASMIDVLLMHALLKAIPPKAALFLVGDIDQLPSVGPGKVLSSLIESNVFPIIKLTEIFRQAATSRIITTAHSINKGHIPNFNQQKDENTDFYFIEKEDPEHVLQNILQLVKQRVPQKFNASPIRDIQVLCPMSRGMLGTRNLNIELQKLLNLPTNHSVHKFGYYFSVGDKVMQIENNYDKEVYNGDIGYIKFIYPEEAEVVITFERRDIVYDFSELDEIVLAYATTIHKAQGSEYPIVIIPLTMQHYPMLQRNLIYTGITRGKRLVIIIGQKKAFFKAIKNNKSYHRWSKLTQHLKF